MAEPDPRGDHAHEGNRARAAHLRPPGRVNRRWEAFARSPFLPATVLVFLVSAVAGVFAWSYTYAFANPTPHRVPIAVIGPPDAAHGAFLTGMETALGTSLVVHRYPCYAQARQAAERQTVFAIFDVRQRRTVTVDVSSASGASVAAVLEQAARAAGKTAGTDVVVRDIKPNQRGDPRGLAIFYISLAAVVVSFVGAIQLSVHAKELGAGARLAFTVAYSLLGAFTITAVVDWVLGALQLPFVAVWLTLALTMYAASTLFLMFMVLIGRWALIPTWCLTVLIGNPSSGGAVSWPLLPTFLGLVGRWLPTGAAIGAIHTEVYFPGYLHAFPFLVLTGWAFVSTMVFCLLRHRRPGAEPTVAAHPE
ncbi:ABC transporter permease [Streptomyces sp. NBC_01176]|uniref:ABC transporter permease n=1 Tax=Streptomyces sp. NBC_01176 TaxID=2903760 RepID=UPI00386A622A|nr:ABC transporter permease [Streptomyces sp. NBC_01176]